MIHCNNNDSFKTMLDRNGQKIHIGESALIIDNGRYVRAQVCAFSESYKYVYLIYWDNLYKRTPSNIVLVHNLNNWKHESKGY
jgi:hypothetical protein